MAPANIIIITIQKSCGELMNGIAFMVFMPNIAANNVNGKTITENTVRVLIMRFKLCDNKDSCVSCKALIVSL